MTGEDGVGGGKRGRTGKRECGHPIMRKGEKSNLLLPHSSRRSIKTVQVWVIDTIEDRYGKHFDTDMGNTSTRAKTRVVTVHVIVKEWSNAMLYTNPSLLDPLNNLLIQPLQRPLRL